MIYRIVGSSKGLTQLEIDVNNMIKYGWRPQGGICVSDRDRYSYYTQAMVKDSDG